MTNRLPMRTTLIIASYNQPRSLSLVLAAVARQMQSVDEIIIADDGSTESTFKVIESFQRQFSLPIKAVVTQQDLGFRKAIALNKAVLKSTGQLLLFLDGDVIPPPHWAEKHINAYRPMGYTVGTYLRLDVTRSKDIADNGIEHISWPALVREVRFDRKFLERNFKSKLYVLLRKSNRPKVWGGNLSIDRGLFYGVNGFDERYCGFGGEDSDIRNRMNNYGAYRTSLLIPTLALHLHPDLDRKEARTESNLGRHPSWMSVYQSSKKNLWAVEGLASRMAAER